VKSFAVNGTELWCEDRGSGKPLVLVHGFPLNHVMWAGQIDAISAQYRVIAPDLRGFGRSDSRREEKVTMGRFADDLASLLDALEIHEPIVFCGLSMGGYIAFQFTQKHADRLRGLILCDTRATADAPAAAEGRLVAANRVLKEGPKFLVDSMLPRLLAKETFERHPHVVEALRAMMMSASPHGIAAAQRGMAERPDATASLAKIASPTLVLVGEEDTSSPPSEMREMAQAIPQSHYVEIPAAGHLSPLENPAAANAAMLAWLGTI
jgi:pimeloyl-ACP methyl ester carboxylesterase